MRRRREERPGSSQHSPVYKFRRRFAKLLIAVGLVYIGAAVAAVGQSPPAPQPAQQFTTEPASSSQLLGGLPANQPSNTSVLGQSTAAPAISDPTPIFIPQCTYRSVPYKTVYKSASWLNSGQQMSTGGWDGEEKICSSQFGPPTISTIIPPLDKTITTGTYVPPSYTYPGYTNVDGNYIPSPNYTGSTVGGYSPSAICGDGSYSYSQNASGTCSSHGGVSSWL
jgi:hypothetical protein